jgi:plasmid stabilization system protein ParE
VKVSYRQAASDDLARQFRYYYPLRNPQLRDLRFWPVAGFETIGVYYVVDSDAIRVIRILHGKRDVRRILERERL